MTESETNTHRLSGRDIDRKAARDRRKETK